MSDVVSHGFLMKVTSKSLKPEIFKAYQDGQEEFQSLLYVSLALITFFALT